MRIRLGREGSWTLSLLFCSSLLAVVASFSIPQYVVDYGLCMFPDPEGIPGLIKSFNASSDHLATPG